jgi:hypothetical protein
VRSPGRATVLFALVAGVPAIGRAEPADANDGKDTGWRIGVKLGDSDGEDSTLPDGWGVGVLVGHETMHGRVGMTKALALEIQHYTTDYADLMGAATDHRQSGIFLLAAVRWTYHGEIWQPWASLGAGFGYMRGITPEYASFSDPMLAVSASVGAEYKLTDTIAFGPFLEYKPCFDFSLNQYWDFGVAATFGL